MLRNEQKGGWNTTNIVKKILAPVGLLGLGLFSSFQMNKLAKDAKNISDIAMSSGNITAIKELANELNHEAYLSSRGAGIAICGILAPPVIFALWDSFKNMKDFLERIKQPFQNWDFILGLVSEMTAMGFFAGSLYCSGDSREQEALAYGICTLFTSYTGAKLITHHQNRTEPAGEQPHQGEEGEYYPSAPAGYRPSSPGGGGTR